MQQPRIPATDSPTIGIPYAWARGLADTPCAVLDWMAIARPITIRPKTAAPARASPLIELPTGSALAKLESKTLESKTWTEIQGSSDPMQTRHRRQAPTMNRREAPGPSPGRPRPIAASPPAGPAMLGRAPSQAAASSPEASARQAED